MVRKCPIRALGLTATLLLGGCGTEPPQGEIPKDHPAHPGAPATPLAPASTTLSSAQPDLGTEAEEPKPPEFVPAPNGAYVCPMHPEIRSDQPGRCPKCHMKLVKKEAGR